MQSRGKLIVLEGLDGAGTTTQMKRIAKRLESEGKKVFITHEPTDNPIGLLVRSVLQKKISTTPLSLALLYASDREDHLNNEEYGINKYLDEGYFVISDRYFYSSIAYQSVDCNPSFIKEINSTFPHADILIFIDTPTDDCMDRIDKRGEEKELFEKSSFLEKVRKNYLNVLKELPESVQLLNIDGRKTIDEVEEEIWKYLSSNLL